MTVFCVHGTNIFLFLNGKYVYFISMKRTKNPHKKRSLKGVPKKTGPESGCTPEKIQLAYRLSLLGLTHNQMASALNIHKDTLTYWKKTNEKLRQAIHDGGDVADSEIVDTLYRKAKGYKHPATKFYKDKVTEREFDEDGNVISEKTYTKIIKVPYIKQYPPDTKALLKILAVRHREDWGEAYKVEHKHDHMVIGGVNITHLVEQLGDTNMFSEEELEVAAKLGFEKQLKQVTNGQKN